MPETAPEAATPLSLPPSQMPTGRVRLLATALSVLLAWPVVVHQVAAQDASDAIRHAKSLSRAFRHAAQTASCARTAPQRESETGTTRGPGTTPSIGNLALSCQQPVSLKPPVEGFLNMT